MDNKGTFIFFHVLLVIVYTSFGYATVDYDRYKEHLSPIKKDDQD